MKLPGTLHDTFSPYLDLDPVADFFDDLAQRFTTVVGTAIGIHLALFFLLQPSFVMPDLKPEEPESIPVQIIAFEEVTPEPAPPEEVIELRPATPAQTPPPPPKPKPAPPPPPPPPPPEETEPEPEILPPPPPPEILAVETPEPELESIPMPAEVPLPPQPEPMPEPEPLPEPIYEPLPLPPEPILEPIIEIWEPIPDPEPVIEPLPEPIPEPELPPEIIIEAPPPPDPQPGPWRPYVRPEPVVTPPTPGPIIEEPLPELPDIEELPPIPVPPEPEVITPAPPAPKIETPTPAPVPTDEAPIVTTAPSILASPEAPTTSDEAKKAVPQSQSNPMNDFLFKGGPKPGSGQPSSGIGKPATGSPGSGRPSIGSGTPFTGATRRGAPGASGWTLAPGSGTSPGEGYKGLVLDIRCREAGKTHLTCPEYLRTYQGRNASGFEAFGAHANSGTSTPTRAPRTGTYENPAVGGGSDVWGARGKRQAIGDNSVNNGGPSTTVLDDADFGREFLGTNLGDGSDPNRVRDVFKGPVEPWNQKPLELPPPTSAPEQE